MPETLEEAFSGDTKTPKKKREEESPTQKGKATKWLEEQRRSATRVLTSRKSRPEQSGEQLMAGGRRSLIIGIAGLLALCGGAGVAIETGALNRIGEIFQRKTQLETLSQEEVQKILRLVGINPNSLSGVDKARFNDNLIRFQADYNLALDHFTPGKGISKNLGYWVDRVGEGEPYSEEESVSGVALASVLQTLGLAGSRDCNADALTRDLGSKYHYTAADIDRFTNVYTKFCRWGTNQPWGKGLFSGIPPKQMRTHFAPAMQQEIRRRSFADTSRKRAEIRSVRRPMGRRST